MITRTFETTSGKRTEQELNELASMIVEFCRAQTHPQAVQDASEWAAGYSQALNTIESIIIGSPGYMVVKE